VKRLSCSNLSAFFYLTNAALPHMRPDRPGQPAEIAPVHMMLASDQASYVSGARIAITGGKPIL
jgi:hypothetical protein